MEDCRAWNDLRERDSEVVLRDTVISTILPEEIEGGRSIEGNSI